MARDIVYRLAASEPGSRLAGQEIALYYRVKKKKAYSERDESSSHLHSLVSQCPSKYPVICSQVSPGVTEHLPSRAQIVASRTNTLFAEWEPGSRYLYS